MEVVRFEQHSALLETFIDLPYRIHGRDPHWIAPFRDGVRQELSPEAPFRSHGERVHFLAFEGATPLARCTALINRRYAENDELIGFVGYFEAMDRYEASAAVLEEAIAWLKSRDIRTIRGPINTSTYQSYRFLTKGFEHGAFFMEPYNPAYYPAHWERFGFKPCRGYASAIVDSQACADRLRWEYAHMIDAGYRARTFDMARFDDELRLMYDLSSRIFSNAWMWRAIAFEEFRAIYSGMRRILDPNLCYFLFKEQEPAGFVFGLPDYAEAVRTMRGDEGLLAKLRFVARRGSARTALLKTFGVVPGRRMGSNALGLCHLFHAAAAAGGYARTIHALMRDDNVSLRMSSRRGGDRLKEYSLYEYKE